MRMMWNESEEEAVALLPEEKQQAVRAYCDAIFDSGADAEQFFTD